jgi:hypothetical protein
LRHKDGFDKDYDNETDVEKRENQLAHRLEELTEKYNQAKQEAAVAKKEVEMLREQTKKK